MMSTRRSYHHGDLRAALIKAGEEVLAETGVNGFSLRQVARRVSVSHSAPAHHFGDANGLLIAMAADGYRRFLAAMRKRQQEVGSDDPRELIFTSGLGYLDFARGSPALFRLMFGSDKITEPSPELIEAGEAAFMHIATDNERLRGVSPFEDESVMVDVMATWSMVHGFAELLISGRLEPVQSLSIPEQETFFRKVFMRTVT